MKYIKFLVLLPTLVLLCCERDDICAAATPTTPVLLIEFFDFTDTETLKPVTRLSVYAENLVTDENGAIVPPENPSSASLIFNTDANNIALPLIVGNEGEQTTTRYIFERDTNSRTDDEDSTTQSNSDIVEITYIPEYVYVSRACGYRSIFTNLQVTVDDNNDDDIWITSINYPNTLENSITVENENETHVNILH